MRDRFGSALRRGAFGACGVVAGLATAAGGAATAQDMRVGTNDLLELRVLGWDSVAGEVEEWPAVSGEYRVGMDGTIVVPFAGAVDAAGRLPSEIEEDIAAGLRDRLALTMLPDITIGFAAWSPIVVTGDVRSPGPVDFSPGMRAIQAVGLAGGTDALAGEGRDLRRDVVAQRTSLQLLRDQELRLVARRARLVAELEGREVIPAEGADGQDAAWQNVLASENLVLRMRRDRLARELAALDAQSELYTAEIAALESKTANLNEQRDLANEEAANASDLAERGLVGNQRVFDTARVLSDIEGQLLDVSTAMLRARQNLAAAEREGVSLQDSYTAETLEALQDVDARLAETRERIRGQRLLLQELGAGSAGEAEPLIAVLRPEGDTLRRIENAALEPLRPGDLVEVVRPAEEDAFLSSLGGTGLPDLDALFPEPVAAEQAVPDLAPAAPAQAPSEEVPELATEAPAVPEPAPVPATGTSASDPVIPRPTVSPPTRPDGAD